MWLLLVPVVYENYNAFITKTSIVMMVDIHFVFKKLLLILRNLILQTAGTVVIIYLGKTVQIQHREYRQWWFLRQFLPYSRGTPEDQQQ